MQCLWVAAVEMIRDINKNVSETWSGAVDAPLRLCASKQEQRPNNEHWCSGVLATVELRQAKEKKHALVPGLSTREENWEHANETELTMRTEYEIGRASCRERV